MSLQHHLAPFSASEKEQVYRAIFTRRDVRYFLKGKDVPDDVLLRLLTAAHAAPSVGLSQPWHFIIIRSEATRIRVKSLFDEHNRLEAQKIKDPQRKSLYESIKLEGILESGVHVAVTCRLPSDDFVAGVGTMPETLLFSSSMAIQNLWLAARAEGIGLCWVSVVDRLQVEALLGIPAEHRLIGYICLGYPNHNRLAPHFEEAGWGRREPLESKVFSEAWGLKPLDIFAHQPKQPDNQMKDDMHKNTDWKQQARKALDNKTKPRGSLGILEEIAVRLCDIQQTLQPDVTHKRILVFAGDHGVTEEGISPFPREVTRQMVVNFMEGGGGINVLTRQHGIEMDVVDVGVGGDWPDHYLTTPGFQAKAVRAGTRNFVREPAMTSGECNLAMDAGRQSVRKACAEGVRLIGIGEMGIGNTTSASALYSALLQIPPSEVCGKGAGASEEMVRKKIDCVTRALQLHKTNLREGPAIAHHWLCCVGGLEIAAMAGAVLECEEKSCAIVVDGFISTAAALVAMLVRPECKRVCFFAHTSDEHAHKQVLVAMGQQAILHLNMRLGEGTGAALAMPVIESAARILNEMATFESARVSSGS